MSDLTEVEKNFLVNLVRQVQVSASAPDAMQVVAVVASILTKLQPKEKP